MAKATFFMMASDVGVFRCAFKKIDKYNIVKKINTFSSLNTVYWKC